MTAADREGALLGALSGLSGALVAFSGGVDSSYLLAVAQEALGERVTALTADSASLARSTLAEARAFCAGRGIRHEVVPTDELARPEYVRNDGLRCYHCKSALLSAMDALAARSAPGAALLVGVIADDLRDVRPGIQAARERGARFPLAEAGFSKADVRERSLHRGLPTWSRPAEPCLSSRIPYGEPVTPQALSMIEAAEQVLHAAGLSECRARHHRVGEGRGALLRIEVPEDDLARVLAARATLLPALKRIGYANVSLDLAGLRSGGFNELLTPVELRLGR